MNVLRILAKDREVVTYRKELKKITGSVTATILLQQIIFWHEKMGGEFYKFIEPPADKDKNNLYKDGDSWTEELAFTKREFQTAFKKLENLEIVKKTIDRRRVTFYKLNEEKIIEKLNEIYKQKDECVATHENVRRVSAKKSVATHENVRSTITETTTETTTESSRDFFEKFLEEKSKSARNKNAYKATLLKKYRNQDSSVVDEFAEWMQNQEKYKIQDKLIEFRHKTIILDNAGYKILGVEEEEDGLHVYLDEMYLNSQQILFQEIAEIEKRLAS